MRFYCRVPFWLVVSVLLIVVGYFIYSGMSLEEIINMLKR